jgi:uncharacterized membrane protein
MKSVIAAITGIILALCLALFGALIMGGIIQYFWNLCIPYIFHVPSISYWQAFSVYILVNILTKPIVSTTTNK